MSRLRKYLAAAVAWAFGVGGFLRPCPAEENLAAGFREPPLQARPWVYWFWSDGNLTREGITADLEAMARVGIGGVLIMEVDQGVPPGPVRFMTPPWREMYRHMLAEAGRLGLEVCMNNDGGWTGSGGPWIRPEESMQMLVWTEARIRGGGPVEVVLAQPHRVRNHYVDIAVLAFPIPAAEHDAMADRQPQITSDSRTPLDPGLLMDGRTDATVPLTPAHPGAPVELRIAFDEAFTAAALVLLNEEWRTPWSPRVQVLVQVSEDGAVYRNLREFLLAWPISCIQFPETSARFYKIVFKGDADAVHLREVELLRGRRIEDISGKAAFMRHDGLRSDTQARLAEEEVVPRESVVDLTGRMSADGRLRWEPPPGRWTVLRLGYTSTGMTNSPAPAEALGLECDKMSRAAVRSHFENFIARLVEDNRTLGPGPLVGTHIDSWEVGSQNWTPAMKEEFIRRRGYDPVPLLPVVTGRYLGGAEVSERFLWDLRRTIGELIAEHYVGGMRELAAAHGLRLSIEAYGDCVFNNLDTAARSDIPMTEFWVGGAYLNVAKAMASAAHTWGRPLVAAEAFTAAAHLGRWQNTPASLKALGDHAFCLGVNRFVIHRYAMQPWLDRRPGMTMGPWGIHFERTETWWEQSTAWLSYLARCQHLLQQGRFVADVAYLVGEGSPADLLERERILPTLPPGYDYDGCTAEVIIRRMSVRDGELVLPEENSYKILVLPNDAVMTPELLAAVRDLVAGGATVAGPRPVRSPSLSGQPAADQTVSRLAEELWGPGDGREVIDHRIGKGRVVCGRPLGEVLADLGVPPDFEYRGDAGAGLRHIHRRAGQTDVYFVASASDRWQEAVCMFRVHGRRPQLWYPDSGRMEQAAVYREVEGRTCLPLRFEPHGSVFVVFPPPGEDPPDAVCVRVTREERPMLDTAWPVSGVTDGPAVELPSAEDAQGVLPEIRLTIEGSAVVAEVARAGEYRLEMSGGASRVVHIPEVKEPQEIAGPWELVFPPGWNAPPKVTLEKLISWTEHPDAGVRYFSGTATYRKSVDLPDGWLGPDRRVYLDLGNVQVIAEVRINHRPMGICWKPPWVLEVTEGLRPGPNRLEIAVTNLWPNRLIGDEQLPDDCTWKDGRVAEWPEWLLEGKTSPTGRVTFTTWKHYTKDSPLLESGLLGPVRLRQVVVKTADLRR